jgi:hypothetical protein
MSLMRYARKAPSPENILHKKQNAFAGRALATETTLAEVSQRLIPRAMGGVIGLLNVLQDDFHYP